MLRNAGPQGGPGMPEWGMLPIPTKLVKQGVRDMVRISDARRRPFAEFLLQACLGFPLGLLVRGVIGDGRQRRETPHCMRVMALLQVLECTGHREAQIDLAPVLSGGPARLPDLAAVCHPHLHERRQMADAGDLRAEGFECASGDVVRVDVWPQEKNGVVGEPGAGERPGLALACQGSRLQRRLGRSRLVVDRHVLRDHLPVHGVRRDDEWGRRLAALLLQRLQPEQRHALARIGAGLEVRGGQRHEDAAWMGRPLRLDVVGRGTGGDEAVEVADAEREHGD